jgi:hypothetical protein
VEIRETKISGEDVELSKEDEKDESKKIAATNEEEDDGDLV